MGDVKMQERDLEVMRTEIDQCDRGLAALLQRRWDLVMDIASYKKFRGLPVKDSEREKQVIEKVAGLMDNPDYALAAKNIMRGIIDQSCLLEENERPKVAVKPLEIGCFGPAGSFTHQALEDFFKDKKFHRQHFNSFEEVIEGVSKGALDYAVLPIENSSTGGITEVYDLLRRFDCYIIGEQQVKIEQNLLGLPGADVNKLRVVYSHPQGFKQSKEFFKDYPEIEQIPFFNTSRSAEEVSLRQDPTIAAVASRKAAELYGLEVLVPSINYNSNNYTRFVIVTAKQEQVPHADKITLIMALKHETGSLYKALADFYHTGLNLLNLESRPMEGKSWEYFFYVDVTGNLNDPLVKDVMKEIKDKCTYCKVLGNYRAYVRED